MGTRRPSHPFDSVCSVPTFSLHNLELGRWPASHERAFGFVRSTDGMEGRGTMCKTRISDLFLRTQSEI